MKSNNLLIGIWLIASVTSCTIPHHEKAIVKNKIASDNITLKHLRSAYGSTVGKKKLAFGDVSLRHVRAARLSDEKIDGSNNNNNQIPSGTIILYKTDEKRYGKLEVLTYGYNLRIKWVTYDYNGSVFSSGDDLLVKGTWTYDLDYGKEGKYSQSMPDIWWQQVDKTERYIRLRNGAKIKVMH